MVSPGRFAPGRVFATFWNVATASGQEGSARRTIGVAGVVLVLAGAVLILLSFRFLHWYDVPSGHDSSGDVTFSKLHSSAAQLGGAGVATAYFAWLAWLLLLAGIALGVAANLPSAIADPLRVTGFVVGLVGAGGTLLALAQHFHAAGSDHGIFHNASWGVWAALAGYALIALGAALGPRRPRSAASSGET
jgi:hypothetical protein